MLEKEKRMCVERMNEFDYFTPVDPETDAAFREVEKWELMEREKELLATLQSIDITRSLILKEREEVVERLGTCFQPHSEQEERELEKLLQKNKLIQTRRSVTVEVEKDKIVIEFLGMMPHLDRVSKRFQVHTNSIKTFYRKLLFEALNEYPYKTYPVFEQAHLIFEHGFSNRMIRDLDNYYKSFLINELRTYGLLYDDSWRELSTSEVGVLSNEYSYFRIYITSQENAASCLQSIYDERI